MTEVNVITVADRFMIQHQQAQRRIDLSHAGHQRLEDVDDQENQHHGQSRMHKTKHRRTTDWVLSTTADHNTNGFSTFPENVDEATTRIDAIPALPPRWAPRQREQRNDNAINQQNPSHDFAVAPAQPPTLLSNVARMIPPLHSEWYDTATIVRNPIVSDDASTTYQKIPEPRRWGQWSAKRPPPVKGCLSVFKKRSRSVGPVSDDLLTVGAVQNTVHTPLIVAQHRTKVQFAPTSAVEFQSDLPVVRCLTPLASTIAAKLFPTEPKTLTTQQQSEIDEAKRNDAALKYFDNIVVDDKPRRGTSASQSIHWRRRRRQSFYLTHTSDDPTVRRDSTTVPRITNGLRRRESFYIAETSHDPDVRSKYFAGRTATSDPVNSVENISRELFSHDSATAKDTNYCRQRLRERDPENGDLEQLSVMQLYSTLCGTAENGENVGTTASDDIEAIATLCSSRQMLLPDLNQVIVTLKAHCQSLPCGLADDDVDRFHSALRVLPELNRKLTSWAEYQWKLLEIDMLEYVSRKLDADERELDSELTAVQDVATKSVLIDEYLSRRVSSNSPIRRHCQLQACTQLESELFQELSRQHCMCNESLLMLERNREVASVRLLAVEKAICRKVDFVDLEVNLVFSTPMENVVVEVRCDSSDAGSIASARIDCNNHVHSGVIVEPCIPKTNVVATISLTMLTAGIQRLVPIASHQNHSSLIGLSTFLGRLRRTTVGLVSLAERHSISLKDTSSPDILSVSVELREQHMDCIVDITYDLSSAHRLLSACPMSVSVALSNGVDECLDTSHVASHILRTWDKGGYSTLVERIRDWFHSPNLNESTHIFTTLIR